MFADSLVASVPFTYIENIKGIRVMCFFLNHIFLSIVSLSSLLFPLLAANGSRAPSQEQTYCL